MNREKLIAKIIKNKHVQAQDEYAKNKPLLAETEYKEKMEHYKEHEEAAAKEKEAELNKEDEKR